MFRRFSTLPTAPSRVPLRWMGHTLFPFAPEVKLLDREPALQMIVDSAMDEYDCVHPDRSYWSVVYAAGRSGGGKTEIGKQTPHAVLRRFKEGYKTQASVIESAAYLFIEANGGGDGWSDQYDEPLDPSSRLGWRLLAAVCREPLGIQGVKELRTELALGHSQQLAQKLEGKQLTNVAALFRSPTMNLACPVTCKAVLLALATDLRTIDGRDAKERVAIFVQVDEHQLLWGKGLPVGAPTQQKLEQHKEFLYDLCTMRGNGSTTWCRDNNIFMFPIFTGTASSVLGELTKPTQFSKAKPIGLPPLAAKNARGLYLQHAKKTPHHSWTTEKDGVAPIDYVLLELGCIPRLVKGELPNNSKITDLLQTDANCDSIHKAFSIVHTHNTAQEVRPDLMRLIVSGAADVSPQCMLDKRTLESHEFDGTVRICADGSVAVPAVDYRQGVRKVNHLKHISDFANLQYRCPGFREKDKNLLEWSQLWERMCMERVSNMMHVQRLLGKDSISLGDLFPGCAVLTDEEMPLPSVCEARRPISLCDNDFNPDEPAIRAAMWSVTEGTMTSFRLRDSHPTFDSMDVHRKREFVWIILQQLKAPVSPTKVDSKIKANTAIEEVCDKFLPVLDVMRRYCQASDGREIPMYVVPVFIDRRKKTNEGVQFWLDYWAKKGEFFPVAGSSKSVPGLFPCLSHRFALLDQRE